MITTTTTTTTTTIKQHHHHHHHGYLAAVDAPHGVVAGAEAEVRPEDGIAGQADTVCQYRHGHLLQGGAGRCAALCTQTYSDEEEEEEEKEEEDGIAGQADTVFQYRHRHLL